MRTLFLALAATVLITSPALAQDLPPDLVIVESLVESGELMTDTKASRDVVIEDFDNDTNLDILFANKNQTNDIFWGDGAGGFTKGVSGISGTLLSEVRDSRGLAVADVDDDGDLDIFVANSSGQENALFINQTAAPDNNPRVFIADPDDTFDGELEISRQGVFFDADNDCDLDLLVTNFSGQNNALYINQLDPGCGGGGDGGGGGPLFVRADAVLAGDIVDDGGNSYGIAAGDIDSDGDIDVYISNHSGIVWTAGDPGPQPVVPGFLYRNNTISTPPPPGGITPLFTRENVAPFTTDMGNSMCAEFADFDDDGDLDLFVGQTHGRADWLYRNQGGDGPGTEGEFVRVIVGRLGVDRGESAGCLWVDIDDDGDLDMLLANRNANGTTISDKRNILYLQVSETQIPRQAFGPLAGDITILDDSYAVAVGDLNKDGQLDVVFANQGEVNSVLRNDGRQWTDQGGRSTVNLAPRFGWKGNVIETEDNQLRLFGGEPNSLAGIVGNLLADPVPLLGGTLIPALPWPLDPVVFATDGSGDIDIPITVGPGLASLGGGIELFMQWICADAGTPAGLSLSNAARVRPSLITP